MFMEIMVKRGFGMLLKEMFTRFMKYSKATQAKYMEAMNADETNPALYKEIKQDFCACWDACDVNKDGVLKCDEFKMFMVKNCENMKKRFGEAEKGPEEEDLRWYRCYNAITSSHDGISMADFKKG